MFDSLNVVKAISCNYKGRIEFFKIYLIPPAFRKNNTHSRFLLHRLMIFTMALTYWWDEKDFSPYRTSLLILQAKNTICNIAMILKFTMSRKQCIRHKIYVMKFKVISQKILQFNQKSELDERLH